jgi:molybdopterin molybdotransferase
MSETLITIAEARERVLSATPSLPTETVAIEEARDRVLTAPVQASANVPPFACSAMDGYAIQAGEAGRELLIVAESRAGTPATRAVEPGQAVRISTGAALPDGATAVIPQEATSLQNGRVRTEAAISEGEHIRGPGEDMRAGTTVLEPGIRLGAVELGAAVAAGVATLEVSARPRASVLCTGDELKAPGEPLGPGEIHNSNAAMLTALAAHCGARTAPALRLPDDREATTQGIAAALEQSEVLIISGGVSVGPHDHVKPALAELGVREVFWRVSLQPGKPTWFGTGAEDQLVFGLPGNPVSAVVTFSLFVAPALERLQRQTQRRRQEQQATLGVAIKRNRTREQAVRVRLELSDGLPRAFPTGAQASHILTSLLNADALAMVPAGEGTLAENTVIRLEPLVN